MNENCMSEILENKKDWVDLFLEVKIFGIKVFYLFINVVGYWRSKGLLINERKLEKRNMNIMLFEISVKIRLDE